MHLLGFRLFRTATTGDLGETQLYVPIASRTEPDIAPNGWRSTLDIKMSCATGNESAAPGSFEIKQGTVTAFADCCASSAATRAMKVWLWPI